VSQPVTIRVATFNILGLPAALPRLADRAVEICRRLDASDIDVVNLQEVWWPRAFAALRAGLPSYPHIAWRRGLGARPAGGLVTFSRRPLDGVSYRSYRGARPDAGRLGFRLRLALNSMLQGVLITTLAGRRTVVANTHVTANKDGDWSAGNRHHGIQRDQLRRLQAIVRRACAGDARAAVLTGDFNVASDSPLYLAIVDHGHWRDPFAETDPPTFHVQYLPPGSTGRRIDYLLVRGEASVADARVLFTDPVALEDGRRTHLSDHVALAARVTLPDPHAR
jgi:endonuclease/exonuclease/phosphatase family metal-dependent hydrolase